MPISMQRWILTYTRVLQKMLYIYNKIDYIKYRFYDFV